MPQPARIPRTVPGKSRVKAEEKRERKAEPHMNMVRKIQICAATGRVGPVEVHHLMHGEGVVRGMRYKSQGRYVVPLHWRVHREITNCGDPEGLLLRKYGLNAHDLSNALWRARGDLDAMISIVGKYTLGRAHGD